MAASSNSFDIIGGFNQQPYVQFDCQRTVNMYVEIDEQAKKPKALVKDPGYKFAFTLAEGSVIRSLSKHRDKAYVVSSEQVYKLDNALSPTHINAALPLNTSSGYIGTAANANDQIIFVDGTAGYLYKNSDASFMQIGDSNFPVSPTAVVFFDSFFIVNNAGTNQFYLSNQNDGATWTFEGNAREATLSSKPDIIVGFAVLQSRLFIFGQYNTEIWYPTAAPIVPLRRDNNMLLEYGCAAVGSIATGHQVLIWLSSTSDGLGPVVMTDGTQPRIVSTKPLDDKIQSYGDISNATGYIYKIVGHVFYDLSFPTVGKTWTYDLNTQLWHEKEAQGGARYIGNCHIYFANKHFLGAYNSRKIYELSEKYYDHDGTPFKWLRIARHLSTDDYKRLKITRVQVDTLKGKAASNGVDASPDIFLGASRNGGVTFGDLQRKEYTKIGNYRSRAIWRNHGIADDWVFSIEGYNSLPFMILGASIDYEVLRS